MFDSDDSVHLTSSDDARTADYQAVSGAAVAAVLLGLASPIAMFSPVLWCVPIAGIVVAIVAWVRIDRSESTLVGRKAAWVGLLVSLVFAVAAPSDWCVHRWLVRREANQVVATFFDAFRQNKPSAAYLLTLPHDRRQPSQPPPPELHGHGPAPSADNGLKTYIQRPEILALLAAGDKADARLHRTIAQWRTPTSDGLRQIYAITPDGASKPNPFFIAITVQRSREDTPRRAHWQIIETEGPVNPLLESRL